MDLASVIKTQKEFYYTGVTKDLQFRKNSLEKLLESVIENEPAIYNALYQDMGRAKQEAYLTEIGPVIMAIKYALKNIDTWVRNDKIKTPRFLMPAKSMTVREPYGTVLIMSHWNYPFYLTMAPLIGTIAAGNCAIIKTSKTSPYTSGAVVDIINFTFDRNYVYAIDEVIPYDDILRQKVEKEDENLVHDMEIKGEITFDHATFGYKSYQPVLEDINVTIKPGEMIGIVGASGTGKSTLINLLMRLYEVDDGRILVDGTDLKEISMKSYRSQLGVVLQETFLFSGTILDNIRFAKPDATYEEVVRAAKMANAHEFICNLRDGYNTYVGERGSSLSGGERQRIAIARAILTNPRLLILDEATSSLDTESEFMIQKALERLTEGKTTFAIAHRLSTLQKADRLMVIDGHRIAEIGTHEELLAMKGIYYRLYNAQITA